MKILFVSEFFPMDEKLKFTGGVESYNYYLVQELSKKNLVTVFCRKTSKKTPSFENQNLKVIPIGPLTNKVDTSFVTIPGRILFIINSIIKGFGQDFDIVQGNNFVVYPIAFVLGLFKGRPKIAWYADVFLGQWIKHTGFISGFLGEIVERIIIKLSWSHFIALSKSTEKKLIKAGIGNKKITTILAGVDLDYFKKIKISKGKIPTIICISRLVSYKRVDLLIEACQILRERDIKFKLVIIGDGPEKDKIINQINSYGFGKFTRLISNIERNKLARELKSADVLCHPSEQEGFGLVVIEGAACQVPYVISDLEVLLEVTHQGLGGLIFKGGDAKDLAEKLEVILKDKNLRDKLGLNALKLANNYSWSKISSEFMKVYEKQKD